MSARSSVVLQQLPLVQPTACDQPDVKHTGSKLMGQHQPILCLCSSLSYMWHVQVGSKITTAVDTFSFGIMMWELYTGQRAYSGLGRDAIIDR